MEVPSALEELKYLIVRIFVYEHSSTFSASNYRKGCFCKPM